MSSRQTHEHRRSTRLSPDADAPHSSGPVFAGLVLLLFASSLLVTGPWAGFHALLFFGVGVMVLLWPPQVALPKSWWALAAIFLLAACAAFLPASWFGMPEWREKLEAAGLDTGSQVTIQSRMALESLVVFAAILMGGLWMAGHRATPSQLRLCALAFTLGVATYAVISRIALEIPIFSGASSQQRFGFFPNRNHTATYLSMGAVCGLGCTLQALRDKRFVILAVALTATAICLWAIASWSISRAGVILVAIGGILWLSMLGRRYLGRHGLWAIALIALTAIGLFFISNTQVRERITSTVEKTASVLGQEVEEDPEALRSALDTGMYLDFRIPIFFDTFDLIREFPLTGVGAGQYEFIMPQYRDRTIIAEGADIKHPESSWLFMASETGLPATLALFTLVVLASVYSIHGIRTGRDRALRAGCLVAAMLVAIHGLIDVPGHRITLAWSAALLFALSLQPLPSPPTHSKIGTWVWRMSALGLIAGAAFLAYAQWGNGPQPARTLASKTSRTVMALYQKDLALQEQAEATGQVHDPDPADDLLEKALAAVSDAQNLLPLDVRLLRLQTPLALHFDDKHALAEKAGHLELLLDPVWTGVPLRQAAAWRFIRPETTQSLWNEAIHRADRVDSFSPGTHTARQRTLQRIQRDARNYPDLEAWSPPENRNANPDK